MTTNKAVEKWTTAAILLEGRQLKKIDVFNRGNEYYLFQKCVQMSSCKYSNLRGGHNS